MIMIDWYCIIAPSECVEKRLLWYSSPGSIITHPHFSHWSQWTQAIVLGWWIVESWMLWVLWPSLSNSWSTYKIHATASRASELSLIVVTWWIMESLNVVTNITLSRYQDKWRSSRTLAAADLRLCDPVIMCVSVRLVLVCGSWMGTFLQLHSPSSPVTGRARPVPPCYLVTIITYNFTTP